MYRQALIAGTLFAMLSVILGAFGAHALKAVLTEDLLRSFETGVKYEMYHSLALLAVGIAYAHKPHKFLRIASVLFILGIILFSGSIYLLVALKSNGQIGLGGFGILTPIGGVLFIIAWLLMLLSFLKKD